MNQNMENLRNVLSAKVTVDGDRLELSRWWTRGATGVVLAGQLIESGQDIVLKCPLGLVPDMPEETGDWSPVRRRLESEALWLETMSLHENSDAIVRFPTLLARVAVEPADGSEARWVLVLDRVFGLSLRNVFWALREGSQGLRWMGEKPGAFEAVTCTVARWAGQILQGLQEIWDKDGIFTDIAPDNFMVGEASGNITFLDAGSIVGVGEQSEVPIRRTYVPRRFAENERYLSVIESAVPENSREVHELLLGMVCGMFVAGLTEGLATAAGDPSVAALGSKFPVAPWLREFFEFGLGQIPGARVATVWHEVPADNPSRLGILGSFLVEKAKEGPFSVGLSRGSGGAGMCWV